MKQFDILKIKEQILKHDTVIIDMFYTLILIDILAFEHINKPNYECIIERLSRVNMEIKSLVDFSSESGKKVYVICNCNLLSIEQHKNILNKFGIYDFFAVHYNQSLPKSSLYIGSKNRIKSCNFIQYSLEERMRQKSYNNIKMSDSILLAVLINYNFTEKLSYWEYFGVNYAAPIYWGFTMWLKSKVKTKNVYFLSRDAYIPYKIFEKLSKVTSISKANYLYCSRRSYMYPYCASISANKAMDALLSVNLHLNERVTLNDIIKNIGLSPQSFSDKLQCQYFSKAIVTNSDFKQAKKFLKTIWMSIVELLKRQRSIFIEYLNQMGIYEQECIEIVDIGWACSAQTALKKITSKKVKGYYLGTIDSTPLKVASSVDSYLFNLSQPRNIARFVMENVMMFEFLFSAPHETVESYMINNEGSVVPIFNKPTSNSQISICTEKYQSAAMKIVDILINYFDLVSSISPQVALENYKNFLERKDEVDLIEFSKLQTTVSFNNLNDKKQFVQIIFENHISKTPSLWADAYLRYDGNKFEKVSNIHKKQLGTILQIQIRICKIINNPFLIFRYAFVVVKKVAYKLIFNRR